MLNQRVVNFLIFVTALSAGFLIARIGRVETVYVSDQVQIEVQQTPPNVVPLEPEVIDEVMYWLDENRPEFSIKLLEIGEGYHGDEVPAKNGDEWLGLFRDGENYRVRPEKLRIKRVHDPVVDGYEDEGIHTGKSVDVASSNKPLFLVKGGNRIKTGKALTFYRGVSDHDYNELRQRDITIYNGGHTTLDKDYQDTFVTPDKQTFELKVIKAKNKQGERILAIALSNRRIRQILYTTRTWDEGATSINDWSGQVGTLLWVGDIDGDGKPDFFLELTAHENSVWKALYLSSEAAEGEHVRLSAQFVISGC